MQIIFPQLRDLKSPGIRIQVRVVRDPDVSHPVRASQLDWIEKIEAVPMHMGGTDRSGQAQTETDSRKDSIFSFSWLDADSGNRWRFTPCRVCLVPALRLAFVSPWSVLGKLVLCSRGSRVLKRSLLTTHALSVPVSYHHYTHISFRLHTGVSAARAQLLARNVARRRHEPAPCMFCLVH
ncbi:hypothetical protein EI94DRAFT_1158091 [Lactarius quietus]|nr:hypothetical protein EI94DRAFT_1158091 [Lactarius quietus]